jgi:hypothetical protein
MCIAYDLSILPPQVDNSTLTMLYNIMSLSKQIYLLQHLEGTFMHGCTLTSMTKLTNL